MVIRSAGGMARERGEENAMSEESVNRIPNKIYKKGVSSKN